MQHLKRLWNKNYWKCIKVWYTKGPSENGPGMRMYIGAPHDL